MKIIIDTDVGADDTFCVSKFVQMHKKGLCEIIGMTIVCGNIPSQSGYKVMSYLLKDIFELNIPIHSSKFEMMEHEYSYYYGIDGHFGKIGLKDVEKKKEDAASFLGKMIDEDTILICIGPLTNLRVCEERNKGILNKAKAIYIMGGVLECEGNVHNLFEFNFNFDGYSSKYVLENANNILLFPLDVTLLYQFKKEYLLNLIPEKFKELFEKIYDEYYKKNVQENVAKEGIVVHDLLLAEYFEDKDKFITVTKGIDINKDGFITYDKNGNQIKVVQYKS